MDAQEMNFNLHDLVEATLFKRLLKKAAGMSRQTGCPNLDDFSDPFMLREICST